MPRPPVDLPRKIRDILQHVQPLPDEARAPILHYRRTGADIWGSLAYIERAVGQGERYQAVVDRHLGRLYEMAPLTSWRPSSDSSRKSRRSALTVSPTSLLMIVSTYSRSKVAGLLRTSARARWASHCANQPLGLTARRSMIAFGSCSAILFRWAVRSFTCFRSRINYRQASNHSSSR